MTSRTRQTTFDESLGRLRVKNTAGITIPPYSCVAIGSASDGVAAGAMDRDGEGLGNGAFLIDVRRPDARALATGSPGQFLFTLNAPIPANRQGYATATLPAWVRVVTEVTNRATSVMPRAGSFQLQPGGGYYTAMDIKSKGSSEKYAFVRPDHHSVMIRARTPSAGIPAATSDSTFPTAECDLYHVIDNGTQVTHVQLLSGSTPIRARVCNLSRTGAIPGNIFVGITRHAGGAFAVTWQDCG